MAENTTPDHAGAVSSKVVRPGIRRSDNLIGTVGFVFIGGILVLAGIAQSAKYPGYAAFLIALGLLIGLLGPIAMCWQYSLVIAPETVALHRLGRRPRHVVRRSEIAKVVWRRRKPRGSAGGFVDAQGEVLFELAGVFPQWQVKQIAAMLEVPYVSAPAEP